MIEPYRSPFTPDWWPWGHTFDVVITEMGLRDDAQTAELADVNGDTFHPGQLAYYRPGTGAGAWCLTGSEAPHYEQKLIFVRIDGRFDWFQIDRDGRPVLIVEGFGRLRRSLSQG